MGVYRLVRHRTAPGSRRRILIGMACWTLGGLALAYVAAVAVPEAFGTRIQLIPLWAPDVGWLLITIARARYSWPRQD